MSVETLPIFDWEPRRRAGRHRGHRSMSGVVAEVRAAAREPIEAVIALEPAQRIRRFGRFVLGGAVATGIVLTGVAAAGSYGASVYFGSPIEWGPKGVDDFVNTFFPSDTINPQPLDRGLVIVVESPAGTGQ